MAAASDVAVYLPSDCASGRDLLSRLDAESLRAAHGAHGFADRDGHPLWPLALQQACYPFQLALCSAGVDCRYLLRSRLAGREKNRSLVRYPCLRGFGMGGSASLNSVMSGMVTQITKPYAHVMMQSVRHCYGNAETQNRVCQTQGIQVAVAQKKRAGNEAPHKRKHTQHGIWDMCYSEQKRRCRNGDGPP